MRHIAPPRPLSLFQVGILTFAFSLWGVYGGAELAAFIFRSVAQ